MHDDPMKDMKLLVNNKAIKKAAHITWEIAKSQIDSGDEGEKGTDNDSECDDGSSVSSMEG